MKASTGQRDVANITWSVRRRTLATFRCCSLLNAQRCFLGVSSETSYLSDRRCGGSMVKYVGDLFPLKHFCDFTSCTRTIFPLATHCEPLFLTTMIWALFLYLI